jgi:DNA polymerase-3 subunit gamma/tau
MAFYLKYRSQTVNDLDITPVREALTRILKAKDIPHAFLFSGPKGTGKTSAARILAKAVNCENRAIENPKDHKSKKPKKASPSSSINPPSSSSPEPCNHCSHCTSITAGSHLDVLEIDAASHRGIDDIRDLRERINLAPADSRYRVYIIDEVHMLTTEAFNALLKTLEEPPAHAIFVLCTTEPQKLLGTIISRCTQIKFRKANQTEILRSLKRVITSENIEISDQALTIIAKQSEGSFRDALKLLEQLALSSEGKITPEFVEEQIGRLSQHQVSGLLTLFHKRDAGKILSWIENAASDGADLYLLARQALELLHQALLARYQISVEDDVKFLESWSPEDLNQLINTLSRVAQDTKTAIIPQLPLEIAAVEWCQPQPKFNPSVAQAPRLKPFTTPSVSAPPNPTFGDQGRSQSIPTTKPGSTEFTQPQSSLAKTPSKSKPPADLSFQSITDQWPQVLAMVKPKNHSVEGLLRATRPKALNGSDLTLEVFYEFHLNQLRAEAKRILVEQAIQEVFNTQLNLICQLGQRPSPPPKPKSNFQPPEFSQRPVSPSSPIQNQPGPSIKPSPLASPTEQEQDLASIAAEIFGA